MQPATFQSSITDQLTKVGARLCVGWPSEEAKSLPHAKTDGEQHDRTRCHLLMRAHPRRCLTCGVRTHQGHLCSPPFPELGQLTRSSWAPRPTMRELRPILPLAAQSRPSLRGALPASLMDLDGKELGNSCSR